MVAQEIIEGWANLLTGKNKAVMEVRIGICQRCNSFGSLGQCLAGCNCFMRAKASVEQAKCPMKKW